ncbi:MAG: DUF4242 domain-containing protein [Actinobacteria bacterium]|nr:DUF4242 domain-containing protein [Actinomycetota bacterium]
MPMYMDRHNPQPDNPITPQDLAEAHMRDLEIQAKYGVRYISYWFDPDDQHVFCLADAPNKEACERVHRESHGLVILFTDMAGSTEMTQRLGDAVAMEVLRAHDDVMKNCLAETRGRQIKHTGDGLMACFGSVVSALDCATRIQQKFDGFSAGSTDEPIRVRVGLAAGEPVTSNDDLYGAAVQLAARICAACPSGGVLASSAVKDLAIGKGFDWEFHGEHELKGFDEPFRLFRLLWA